jgi:hypothetical protein
MAVVTASYGRKSQTLPGPITGDAQKESSWYKGHEGMLGVGLVKDFLFPAIFTFVPANALGRLTGKQLTDLSWDLIGACTQAGFDATASLATLDWNGASWAIIKGVATDEKLRETVGALIATRVLSNYSSKTSRLIAGSAKLLMKALKVIDYAYLGIDYVAIERDCARSDTYNYFTLTAVPPVVRIEPSPACVHPGMSVNLTTYKNIATAGSYTYSYSTKGKYGTLSAGAQSGIAFDSTSETVTYNCKPDAAVGATETVKVVVERRIVTDSGYQMNTIGEATVNITVTAPAITIDPPVKSVSANSAAEFAARYDDAVSTDTRLMYHWTNTGKAGHLLDASSAASDDFTTSSATVAYVAGTSAGNDTVTVEVLLVVDGKSYPQGKAAALVTVTNDNYKTAGERRVIWKVVQTTTSGDPTRFDMTAMYLVVWKKPPTVYTPIMPLPFTRTARMERAAAQLISIRTAKLPTSQTPTTESGIGPGWKACVCGRRCADTTCSNACLPMMNWQWSSSVSGQTPHKMTSTFIRRVFMTGGFRHRRLDVRCRRKPEKFSVGRT